MVVFFVLMQQHVPMPADTMPDNKIHISLTRKSYMTQISNKSRRSNPKLINIAVHLWQQTRQRPYNTHVRRNRPKTIEKQKQKHKANVAACHPQEKQCEKISSASDGEFYSLEHKFLLKEILLKMIVRTEMATRKSNDPEPNAIFRPKLK